MKKLIPWAAALALAIPASAAQAQPQAAAFPDKPVRIIVPFLRPAARPT